jgi:hypothetical protein
VGSISARDQLSKDGYDDQRRQHRPGHTTSPAASARWTKGAVVNKTILATLGGTAMKAGDVEVVSVPDGNGRVNQVFLATPDELRIEIIENKTQRCPIQHHHVHFFVPEGATADVQAWYGKAFGAEPGSGQRFRPPTCRA